MRASREGGFAWKWTPPAPRRPISVQDGPPTASLSRGPARLSFFADGRVGGEAPRAPALAGPASQVKGVLQLDSVVFGDDPLGVCDQLSRFMPSKEEAKALCEYQVGTSTALNAAPEAATKDRADFVAGRSPPTASQRPLRPPPLDEGV